MEYSFSKSTVECYKFRRVSGSAWADINIDAYEKTGRIQIASDYGDWQYYWGSCGCSFKKFLLSLNKEYVAGKFGEGRHFDVNKTIALNKKLIIDWRRAGDFNEEQSRLMWDELVSLEGHDDANMFAVDWMTKDALSTYFEESPDLCYSISPHFEEFWNTCWRVFCDELKKELV